MRADSRFTRRENPGSVNSVRDHFKIQMADRWMANSIRRMPQRLETPDWRFEKKMRFSILAASIRSLAITKRVNFCDSVPMPINNRKEYFKLNTLSLKHRSRGVAPRTESFREHAIKSVRVISPRFTTRRTSF